MIKRLLILCTLFASMIAYASAQGFVYTPNNPSFGGSAFNSSHLLGVANAQNKFKDPAVLDRQNASTTDLFISQLQSRLLSGLAAQVTEAIFGDNPQESGQIVFGDQTIRYNRGIENVFLVIEDNVQGTRTEIEIPLLTTPEVEVASTPNSLALNPAISPSTGTQGQLEPLNINPLGSTNNPGQ